MVLISYMYYYYNNLFLVGFVIAIVEYHSKKQCSFEHTEECKCVNFRPYLKHEAFNYDLK